MGASALRVRTISRTTDSGDAETLEFASGVNVLVGPPNTGKTKWLTVLDYLMGEKGSAQDALGDDIADKYASARCVCLVDGSEVSLERRWHDWGSRGTIFLNEAPVPVEDFDLAFLGLLNIPLLHYPQGNPYGPRTWPRLGWRSLLRHVYRRQDSWGDIADRQPESEQHAVVMQFAGVAETLFSEQFGALVSAEKKVTELKARRSAFATLLNEVSAEIVGATEASVVVTAESLGRTEARITEAITSLEEARRAMIARATTAYAGKDEPKPVLAESLEAAVARADALQTQRETELARLRSTESRLTEARDYEESLEGEIQRLARATSAADQLDELRITHCPACDQRIARTVRFDPVCYVCGQAVPDAGARLGVRAGTDRLRLEMERVQAELEEARDLRRRVEQERDAVRQLLTKIEDHIEDVAATMRPLQDRVVRALPSALSEIQVALGREQEKLLQISRIRRSMEKRQDIVSEIATLETQIFELQGTVERAQAAVDLERPADSLAKGMNMYVNALNETRANAWTQRAIGVRMTDRRVAFLVGDRQWRNQLGGTLRLYFLLSYHFGLLHLSTQRSSRHPGILILDFPPELDDGSTIRDKENFVLEPFVSLLDRNGYENCQVIAAGNAFEGLVGANRIELNRVWR